MPVSIPKHWIKNLLVVTLSVVIVSTSFIEYGAAQISVVWEDAFDDGDFEDWTIEGGGSGIVDGALTGQWILLWPALATVYHESSGSNGNWSFDIGGYTPSVWFVASSPNHRNVTGYRFARLVDGDTHMFRLFRVVDRWETILASSVTTNETFWNHVEVLRTEDGLFTVSLNDSQIMSVEDTNITTSAYFVFGAYSPGDHLDNVKVDTQSILISPEPIPPEPPDPAVYVIVGALFITVAIILLEVRKRRV
ncbi:MAG: hypothetical protein P1Q69_04000 [Candidatus Thorarchaeota archaeon]|nr:hypothetical protein [Candidatus Thorarchaeota archaeon]